MLLYKLDIACTVHYEDFHIFVQQMHKTLINNHLFLIALLQNLSIILREIVILYTKVTN